MPWPGAASRHVRAGAAAGRASSERSKGIDTARRWIGHLDLPHTDVARADRAEHLDVASILVVDKSRHVADGGAAGIQDCSDDSGRQLNGEPVDHKGRQCSVCGRAAQRPPSASARRGGDAERASGAGVPHGLAVHAAHAKHAATRGDDLKVGRGRARLEPYIHNVAGAVAERRLLAAGTAVGDCIARPKTCASRAQGAVSGL